MTGASLSGSAAGRPRLAGPPGVVAGALLLIAFNALVIVVARLLDPGAPIVYVSNIAATFIGAIQLLYGLPLALLLRRRRPALAAGIALGLTLTLLINTVALFN